MLARSDYRSEQMRSAQLSKEHIGNSTTAGFLVIFTICVTFMRIAMNLYMQK